MDPLSVLRDYATRGHLEKLTRTTTVPAEIHFLNPNNPSATAYTFTATVETPYRSKQGTPYTLDSLLFFLQNHHLKHTDYLQSARNLSIPAVTFTDRKPLLDFLLSKSSSSSLPILPPLPLPDEPLPKRPALADPGPSDNLDLKEGGGDANDYDEIVDVMEMIRAVERPLKDREGILLCRNMDFYSVLVSSTKREAERQRMEMQQRKDGLVAKSRLMGAEDRGLGLGLGFGGGGEELVGFGDVMGSSGAMGSSGGKSKLGVKKVGGEGVPIILVPSAFQTLITIYNVKEFLEDGVYVPTEVKVKGMGKKPEVVTMQKKFVSSSSRERGGVRAAYEVRDKVTGLKADDWERVIAAFVLGKEWQFKDWPFKDHVEIFNKILGFYLRFEDDSVESAKNVKQWNVKIISISKNKRHQDRAAALEVWDRLEEFMRARSRA